MLADFTVLSADIMKIPEPEILNTHCVMTVIGSELVYAQPPLSRRRSACHPMIRQPERLPYKPLA
jgi:hypothetical protein